MTPQKLQQPLADLLGLLLLHPMAGAVEQVSAEHAVQAVPCMRSKLPGRW
jgi:hypothetical protein